MLPNYPNIKERILKNVTDRLQEYISARLGIINKVSKSIIFEGDRGRLERADGTVQEIDFKRIEGSLSINKEDLKSLSPEDLESKLEELADEIAKKQSEKFYETLGDEVEAAGNSIDGKGKPFSIELYFEMFDKVIFDFDPVTGNPILPKIVANPETLKAWQPELDKLELPENKKRFETMIEKQRADWIVRESNRKLVG